MDNQTQSEALNKEIVKLFQFVQAMKKEISTLKGADEEDDQFRSVADQLDEMMETVRKATEEIRDSADKIAKISEFLSDTVKYQGAKQYFEKILSNADTILDASLFQKEMEQRVSNVVQTMNQIEGTLNSLVVIVGDDEVAPLSNA